MDSKAAIRIHFVSPEGAPRELRVPVGWSAMDAAIQEDLDGILATCGGIGDCATCHVYVHPDFLPLLPPVEPFEREALKATATDSAPNSRLSCQIVATPEIDGIVLYLPEKQL